MFEKYLLKKYKLCLSPAAEASDVTRQGGDGTRPGATPFINDFLVPGQHFTCNHSANMGEYFSKCARGVGDGLHFKAFWLG